MIYAAAILLFLCAIAMAFAAHFMWEESVGWREDKEIRISAIILLVLSFATVTIAWSIIP